MRQSEHHFTEPVTVSEIVARRDQLVAAIQEKYWNLRTKLMADCQAEIDAVEAEYRRAMHLNRCRNEVASHERKAA